MEKKKREMEVKRFREKDRGETEGNPEGKETEERGGKEGTEAEILNGKETKE